MIGAVGDPIPDHLVLPGPIRRDEGDPYLEDEFVVEGDAVKGVRLLFVLGEAEFLQGLQRVGAAGNVAFLWRGTVLLCCEKRIFFNIYF